MTVALGAFLLNIAVFRFLSSYNSGFVFDKTEGIPFLMG